MARRARKIQNVSDDDDDAPEVVSHSTSKADAKRSQKALQTFEAEERSRKKAHNRERDRKLKERTRVTKDGKTREKPRRAGFDVDQVLGGESGDKEDDVEARMLRAMREAADEMESDGGKDNEDDEFKGFKQEMGQGGGGGMASSSDSSFGQDEDDEDAEMSLAETDSIDPEVPTDDEETDDDEEAVPPQSNIVHKLNRKADYLADDIFAAAFASQKSKSLPKASSEQAQQQAAEKRRPRSLRRPKDLLIGGRTIRTLPRPSDPQSQSTARSVPSARARKFVDQSLAIRGKQSLAKAKKRGWERRPVNVGVMKCQGAPHGFARSTR